MCIKETHHVRSHGQFDGIGRRLGRGPEEIQNHHPQANGEWFGCYARQHPAQLHPRLQALPVCRQRRDRPQGSRAHGRIAWPVQSCRQLLRPGRGGLRVQARRLVVVPVRHSEPTWPERRRYSGVPVHLAGGQIPADDGHRRFTAAGVSCWYAPGSPGGDNALHKPHRRFECLAARLLCLWETRWCRNCRHRQPQNGGVCLPWRRGPHSRSERPARKADTRGQGKSPVYARRQQ